MTYCATCGAPLPPGAQFCPKCGTPAAEHLPAAVPPPTRPASDRGVSGSAAGPKATRRGTWWIIPLVLLVFGGLAWLVLAGLPFGRDDREPEAPRVETIAEGTVAPSSPGETGTIIDVPGERESGPVNVPARIPPNVAEPEPEPDRKPVNVPDREPVPEPKPVPDREPAKKPAPAPEQPRLLTDAQAAATLRDYVTSRDYYDVEDDCLRIESRGFRNRGFAYEVWHSCERGGRSRLLGRWRVDALTREVFRQRGDGRYLRP